MQIPKGFEKYLPKGDKSKVAGSRASNSFKESMKQSASGKKSTENANNPFKSDGGSGGGGMEDNKNVILAMVGFAVGALGLSILLGNGPTKFVFFVCISICIRLTQSWCYIEKLAGMNSKVLFYQVEQSKRLK